MQLLSVPLSRLIPSKRNPRRVKPAREAHDRLVALIKAQGLIHPLVVQPSKEKVKHFVVMIGNRRLAALRDVHRNDGDPRIPCTLRKVTEDVAAALSLGENVGREPMHPLDEAEAFANLAKQDGKDAAAIASEFGVPERYVRQRMKLAVLATPIKDAYRTNAVDTSTAEVFAAVPEDRQLEVWEELGGTPRSAEQVRSVIANAWIDAALAIFDRGSIPQSAVSEDLFGERVLIERGAFFEAQKNAVGAEATALKDDGWSEVVVGAREDVQDRLFAMDPVKTKYDAETLKKLSAVEDDRKKRAKAAKRIDRSDDESLSLIQSQFAELDEKRRHIESAAKPLVSEETKARASVFLILNPDGQVERHYRIARRKPDGADGSGTGKGNENASSRSKSEVPTSDDLGDRQLAVTFTHQALCVREALSRNALARKRVLAVLLHEKVRSEAIAIHHDANGTTLHAGSEGFVSAANDRLGAVRAKVDPFLKAHYVDDAEAYTRLGELSEKKLDALLDVLVVCLLTAHPQRPTALITHLADELKVNVRNDWKPDADWLGSFQKIQLAHLVTDIRGAVHAPAPERKKSELVTQLAALFADAASGKLEDKGLAEKLNCWLPANLRPEKAKG